MIAESRTRALPFHLTMPTDVPLSARSLGPAPGLLGAASTQQFLQSLADADAQRSALPTHYEWQGPQEHDGGSPAGRPSTARDRVLVVTEMLCIKPANLNDGSRII